MVSWFPGFLIEKPVTQKSQTFVWLEDILVAAQGFSAGSQTMLPCGGGCAVAIRQSRIAGAEPRQ
jgi:hypothetical protein